MSDGPAPIEPPNAGDDLVPVSVRLGNVVPPEDPGTLAETLGELLADRSSRDALADAATRAAATTYSWDRIGEATMALYRDLIGPRR